MLEFGINDREKTKEREMYIHIHTEGDTEKRSNGTREGRSNKKKTKKSNGVCMGMSTYIWKIFCVLLQFYICFSQMTLSLFCKLYSCFFFVSSTHISARCCMFKLSTCANASSDSTCLHCRCCFFESLIKRFIIHGAMFMITYK